MKLRSIAIVLTLALASAAAHAQSGVYVTMDSQQFTQEGVNLTPASTGSQNIDRPWLFGPGFGIYYDVTRWPDIPKVGRLKTGPIVVGIDGRGDIFRSKIYGTQIDRMDGLFGLRFAPKATFHGTTPYAFGDFGIGHTKTVHRTAYSNNMVFQFGIGVDKKIHKGIDWRVVEASAGFLRNYYTGYSQTGIGPNQSNYLVTLGTGLVFRIR
jgi:hypothetical protein